MLTFETLRWLGVIPVGVLFFVLASMWRTFSYMSVPDSES